jgi:hypothetical protein
MYYVSMSRGFLVPLENRYVIVRNPRLAHSFPTYAEADSSAKEALKELPIPDHEQYYAVFQPALA